MDLTKGALGSGLEMTHFFNNKQVLMENVTSQDLTPLVSINFFTTFFKASIPES